MTPVINPPQREGTGVDFRSEGRVGDPPLTRPGLESKYPLGKDVGLPGMVRFHVEGINAIGDELNVVYAPERFNISETARVENRIRAWRDQVGDELYYDFKVKCHVHPSNSEVTILVLDSITWKLQRRILGTPDLETLFEYTGTP